MACACPFLWTRNVTSMSSCSPFSASFSTRTSTFCPAFGSSVTSKSDPVSNVCNFCPDAWSWFIISEYCCRLASAPDFSKAAWVAVGKCLTSVPGSLLKNISSSACRAV